MENKDFKKVNCSICKIPFKTYLSFQGLIKDIEAIEKDDSHAMQSTAQHVLSEVKKVPELLGNDVSEKTLKQHAELVKKLMLFTFNPLLDEIDLSAAWKPFDRTTQIHATSAYQKQLGGEHMVVEMAKDIDVNLMMVTVLYQAYFIILDRYFNLDIPIDLPFTLKLTNSENGQVKFFNKRFNSKYITINTTADIAPLSEEQIKLLFDNDHNLDLWNEIIPLDKFEFSGFLQFSYYDVSRDYVISEMKSDLIRKETIISREGYLRIKDKIRTLIENPNAEFGMAANYGFETNLNQNFIWNTIVPKDVLDCHDYQGSMYEKAFLEQRMVLTNDFEKEEKNNVVEAFLAQGIRSHAVVPLVLEGEVMGMLEFGCKKPGGITMLQLKLLHDLFPVFALAMKRSKEDWDDLIRSVIQEEFTAIHPTVEWRFREAASKLINREFESSTLDPIVFPEVIPIYGASDIRGSSVERNHAIREDLKEQLLAASSILQRQDLLGDVPLINDLRFVIETHLKTVSKGLKAGDEVVIVDFLKKEIDPLLMLLKRRFPELEKQIDTYCEMLDPELGVLYKKRKDFEDSLTMINDKVSEIIDVEQVNAQRVFPHYFEKYRTDGIEYNAYIGQSMVKDLEYSDIYLKNLRLWQLLVMVKVARTVKKIQPSLKTKLDITQLILVHSNPLSIAFRQDEKKFDVAGAYNIRYEITKKRIDKALVKGTKERVTQVGKIAIVYSHADEITEYKRYIDYLAGQGMIKPQIEDLELEDLKGASGLKAMRIEVDFNGTVEKEWSENLYEEVVGK
ncbi:MAG: GAF domain-containing protein [Carboxylicivirga sp.]|jgi:hypothetical protein|nr:GAF domain-containing protein [Carboxylicivirga sp.]